MTPTKRGEPVWRSHYSIVEPVSGTRKINDHGHRMALASSKPSRASPQPISLPTPFWRAASSVCGDKVELVLPAGCPAPFAASADRDIRRIRSTSKIMILVQLSSRKFVTARAANMSANFRLAALAQARSPKLTGSVTVSAVPSPSALVSSIAPPSARTRSPMPSNPSP